MSTDTFIDGSIFHLFRWLFYALALTIVVESIPLLFLKPRKKWLSTALLCNVLTNPMLNCLRILHYSIYPNERALMLLTLCLEVAVVLGEGWFYRELVPASQKKALLVSALCNGLSFVIGLLVF